MRERPIRGKKYRLFSGDEVVALEEMEDSVKVILPDDKLTTIAKRDIDLPVIDTRDYEKIK